MGRFPLLWEGSFKVACADGGGGQGDARGDAGASKQRSGGGQSSGDALEVPARSLRRPLRPRGSWVRGLVQPVHPVCAVAPMLCMPRCVCHVLLLHTRIARTQNGKGCTASATSNLKPQTSNLKRGRMIAVHGRDRGALTTYHLPLTTYHLRVSNCLNTHGI